MEKKLMQTKKKGDEEAVQEWIGLQNWIQIKLLFYKFLNFKGVLGFWG